MQSNPIQQRIELICEKWEDAKKQKEARIVCIQCQSDELDMVDTFYTYMIGADTPIFDIAFHFDSRCYDSKDFSIALLKELEEVTDIWNNSVKDNRIDYVPVHWKPDYTLQNDKNPAALFVANFNKLAKELNLPEDLFAVAVFKGATMDKRFVSWLRSVAELHISTKVKFLIHEVVTYPQFESINIRFPSIKATIPLNLNMPKVMEQVAAMGDPNDPGISYRRTFMKMMNAMGANKESEAEKCGLECIAIATENLSKDPYWIMQVVVVNIALGNDKIRYRKKNETIAYANKAMETAIAAQAYFENDAGSGLVSQALMFRASVFFMQSAWSKAYADFSTAFELFPKQGNVPLAIEASRMAGQCAFKEGQKTKGIEILANGVRLGKSMDPDTVRGSTYSGLLNLLLQTDYHNSITPDEVHEIAQNVYGPDWIKAVRNWNKLSNEGVVQPQETEVAGT